MPKKINWTGTVKGKLTVTKEAGVDNLGNVLWECVCECGAVVIKPSRGIRNSNSCSVTCGVADSNIKRAVHGLWKSRIYRVWIGMKARCLQKGNANFARYGGRGITIQPEWIASFEAFYTDVGDAPKGMSLDRIDNSKGYVRGNVRWANLYTQQNNMRSNTWLTYDGKTQTLAQWARELGIPYHRVVWRHKKGYPAAKVLSRRKLVGL
jgi:hypothetical protein